LSDRSPTIDILGSYFPAWMICILSGLALLRRALDRSGWQTGIVHWSAPLIYSSLMIIFTFAIWILFYQTDMHQAATPSNKESVATSGKSDIEQHKFVRKIVSLIVVVSAVVIHSTSGESSNDIRGPMMRPARQRGGHCAACEWSNPQAECAG